MKSYHAARVLARGFPRKVNDLRARFAGFREPAGDQPKAADAPDKATPDKAQQKSAEQPAAPKAGETAGLFVFSERGDNAMKYYAFGLLERWQIEGRQAHDIAAELTAAFNEYCRDAVGVQ